MAAFVNNAALEKKINNYLLHTPAGKKKIDERVIGAIRGNGGISDPDFREGWDIAEQFINILKAHINESAGFDYAGGNLGSTAVAAFKNINYSDPKMIDSGTAIGSNTMYYSYKISIYFTDNLHRDSLNPNKYPNGVQDIVVLLDHGYSASGSVAGVWKGHTDKPIKSLKKREGAYFVEEAIREYMDTYARIHGVTAIMSYDLDITEYTY